MAEHLSFLLILSGAVRRYQHLWKSGHRSGINWHIFRMCWSNQQPEQGFGKHLNLCKTLDGTQNAGRGPGSLVWVMELPVGFSMCGLLLLPWEHPCAQLVTQQWIGRVRGGVKLL